MARTLIGEIFNQVTGHKEKSKPKLDKEREKYKDDFKQAIYESRKSYDIAQARARVLGVKK